MLTEEQVRDIQVKSWEAGRKNKGATYLARIIAEYTPIVSGKECCEKMDDSEIAECIEWIFGQEHYLAEEADKANEKFGIFAVKAYRNKSENKKQAK